MTTNQQRAILAILFGVIVFSCLYKLTESPPVWYDEGFYIQAAHNLAQFGQAGMVLSPNTVSHISQITVGYPLIYPLALVFKLFGYGVFQARLFMIFLMLAFVSVDYYLAEKLYGPNNALWALAILAVFAPFYANGKSVLGEVPGVLFLAISLLCLNLGRTKSKHEKFYLILAGLSAGLAAATKPVFLLIIPAVIFTLLIKRRSLSYRWSNLALSIFSFLIPMLVWLLNQFQAGDSLRTILGFYANPYQINNLSATILTNALKFLTDTGPLFLLVMVAIWLVAVRWRYKRREATSLEETLALVFIIISTIAYLRTGGWYRYIFPYQVLALIFFPAQLGEVVSSFPWPKFISPWRSWFAPLILVSLIVLGSYQLGFNSWVADAYNSHKTAFWRDYFLHLSVGQVVFFYDTPEVAIFDQNNNYYQYLAPAGWTSDQKVLAALAKGESTVVIVTTANLRSTPDLFSQYKLGQEVYKYSILVQR